MFLSPISQLAGGNEPAQVSCSLSGFPPNVEKLADAKGGNVSSHRLEALFWYGPVREQCW